MHFLRRALAALALSASLQLAACSCDGGGDDDLGDDSLTVAADSSSTSAGDPSGASSANPNDADDGDDRPSDDDAGTTTGVDDQCHGTDECEQGSFCVAQYADNHRDAFECVDACVAAADETVWCFDDVACCEPGAVCTIRGYCEQAGGSSSSEDGASSGGTDNGTDSSSGSSSGTDSGSSSSSGGA